MIRSISYFHELTVFALHTRTSVFVLHKILFLKFSSSSVASERLGVLVFLGGDCKIHTALSLVLQGFFKLSFNAFCKQQTITTSSLHI